VTDRKMDPDFEAIINELRTKQKQEERRRVEEKLEQQRLLKELKEKAKKKTNKDIYNIMYDMSGNPIELQDFNKLSPFSRTCTSSWKDLPKGNKMRKTMRAMKIVQKNPVKNDKLWETEFYNSMPKNLKHGQMAKTYQQIYDNIIPEEGVTIKERGKNPKTRGGEVRRSDSSDELTYFPGTSPH
jgi:hypothetical protein